MVYRQHPFLLLRVGEFSVRLNRINIGFDFLDHSLCNFRIADRSPRDVDIYGTGVRKQCAAEFIKNVLGGNADGQPTGLARG